MDKFMREKKIKEKIVNCNIVCTKKNRNKENEKARSGKGRSCLSYTSYHARSKPLFYCMSGLSVSIRGIIIQARDVLLNSAHAIADHTLVFCYHAHCSIAYMGCLLIRVVL